MDDASWEQIKSQYKLGQFIQGNVEFHAPFGIFLTLEAPHIKGLIKLPDFLDEGTMDPSLYPELGAMVGAVVVGYNESNRREIYLSAKPSVLHKALVPLKLPALMI
ncbi:MAG: RNA-binding protein [Cyanobacteria bacterium]|nr:RNA-binding protein [Cyanobacteriota bacterium]